MLSLGALVWIFQDGHLAGLLGFRAFGAVELWAPIIVFVFAFGLSMDDEVFLLSRIKEAYDETGDTNHAVATGLQRSGRIITSAAFAVVIVFLGFAAGHSLGIEEFGLALAIAVTVDATLVRCVLVPATMTLLGRQLVGPETPEAHSPAARAARVHGLARRVAQEPVGAAPTVRVPTGPGSAEPGPVAWTFA